MSVATDEFFHKTGTLFKRKSTKVYSWYFFSLQGLTNTIILIFNFTGYKQWNSRQGRKTKYSSELLRHVTWMFVRIYTDKTNVTVSTICVTYYLGRNALWRILAAQGNEATRMTSNGQIWVDARRFKRQNLTFLFTMNPASCVVSRLIRNCKR